MRTELAEELTKLEEEHKETLNRIGKVLNVALGEDWYNQYQVAEITDYGIGIAEPGYSSDGPTWVLGDWNPKRWPKENEPPLTNLENLPARLGEIFERIGVFTGWLDEWVRCDDCQRIFRTQPDSYLWRMYGLITEEGSVLCADCLEFDDIEEDFVNNSDRALTFDIDLEEEGFVLFVDAGDPRGYKQGTYESGFHPGQNDNPEEILERAHSQGWQEGIFIIPSVGQFDLEFQLWVRRNEEEEID